MLGLTQLGVVHTAISLVAVGAAVAALARHREVAYASAAGRVYVIATALTCLTGFGIFQHGGFGKPHALGVLTLLVLGLAAVAGYTAVLGRLSRYVETVAYSLTFFFHWIPGLTETFTRVPTGAPLFSSPEDPNLQTVVGVLFVIFLVGATLQVLRLRRTPAVPVAARIA